MAIGHTGNLPTAEEQLAAAQLLIAKRLRDILGNTFTVENQDVVPSDAIQMRKFGSNPAVGAAYESVVSFGGLYPWASWGAWDGAGASVTFSSSSAADQSIDIEIQGLAVGGALETRTVTTNAADGTVATSIGANLTRLHSARVVTAGGLAGTVTFVFSGTAMALATVDPNVGAAEIAIFTVPLGHLGYLQGSSIGVNDGNEANVALFRRPPGEAFSAWDAPTIASGSPSSDYTTGGWSSGPSFVEGTDFDMRAVKVSGAGPVVSASFRLLLVPT